MCSGAIMRSGAEVPLNAPAQRFSQVLRCLSLSDSLADSSPVETYAFIAAREVQCTVKNALLHWRCVFEVNLHAAFPIKKKNHLELKQL